MYLCLQMLAGRQVSLEFRGHDRKLGVIYFPTNWGAKEPQNLPNHRVYRDIQTCQGGCWKRDKSDWEVPFAEQEGLPKESFEVNSSMRSMWATCEGNCGLNEYPIKVFELPKMPKNRFRSLKAQGNKSMPAYFFKMVIACSKILEASKANSGRRIASVW